MSLLKRDWLIYEKNIFAMAFIWITKTALHFNFKVRKELLSSTFVRSS